jgi:pimeloyl-ACP methyl ester carboxylesterase
MTIDRSHRSIWGHLLTTPFKQDWVNAGGIRTRYVQAGPAEAPAVVMIHGTGSSWEAFCANLESHSKHFNCFALDLAGSGFSDKPDRPYDIRFYVEHVRAFMDALGIAKASLIGVSLGAWIAGRFVVTYPERVERMTLLATSGMVVNRQTMNRTIGVRTSAVDDPSWENIERVFDSILYDPKDRIDDLVKVRQTIYLQPEMKQAMEHILVLQDPDVRERNLVTEDEWRTVKAPLLIILAPDDNPDYYVTGKRIAEIAPDARTLEVKGVKHWTHFERPELFNRVNIAFLKGEEPDLSAGA